MPLLIKLLVSAGAFWLVAYLLPGVDVREGVVNYLVIAVIFGLVNAFIGPILRLLSFPITMLTLGLFRLVINAALVGITAWLTSRLQVDGFVTAVLAALIISAVTWVADQVFGDKKA
ncbi:MAG: phage holin family protein [Mycobacteriales bacterium]